MSYLRKRAFKKIVLSGLSQVGTTTVAYSLCKGIAPPKSLIQHSTIDYVSTSITIGKRRIDIFDLGGQTVFQDKFIGELSETIFSGVKSFIYVVDSIEIKDISRVKYYFDQSLEEISQFSPNASIFIFLHKIDLIPTSVQPELQQTVTQYLREGVSWNLEVYCTSIFSDLLRTANKAVLLKTLGIHEFTVESEAKNDFWAFVDEERNQEAEPDYVKKRKKKLTHTDEKDDMLSLSLREALRILREKD